MTGENDETPIWDYPEEPELEDDDEFENDDEDYESDLDKNWRKED